MDRDRPRRRPAPTTATSTTAASTSPRAPTRPVRAARSARRRWAPMVVLVLLGVAVGCHRHQAQGASLYFKNADEAVAQQDEPRHQPVPPPGHRGRRARASDRRRPPCFTVQYNGVSVDRAPHRQRAGPVQGRHPGGGRGPLERGRHRVRERPPAGQAHRGLQKDDGHEREPRAPRRRREQTTRERRPRNGRRGPRLRRVASAPSSPWPSACAAAGPTLLRMSRTYAFMVLGGARPVPSSPWSGR